MGIDNYLREQLKVFASVNLDAVAVTDDDTIEVRLALEGKNDTPVQVDPQAGLDELERRARDALGLKWAKLRFAANGADLAGHNSLTELGVGPGSTLDVQVKAHHARPCWEAEGYGYSERRRSIFHRYTFQLTRMTFEPPAPSEAVCIISGKAIEAGDLWCDMVGVDMRDEDHDLFIEGTTGPRLYACLNLKHQKAIPTEWDLTTCDGWAELSPSMQRLYLEKYSQTKLSVTAKKRAQALQDIIDAGARSCDANEFDWLLNQVYPHGVPEEATKGTLAKALFVAVTEAKGGEVATALLERGVPADSPHTWVVSEEWHSVTQTDSWGDKKTSKPKLRIVRGTAPILTAATQAGNLSVDMATLLLSRGASIHGHDQRGWTALHYAAEAGDADLVRLYVDRGALVDAPADSEFGRRTQDVTPQSLAAAQSNCAVKELLRIPPSGVVHVHIKERKCLQYLTLARLQKQAAWRGIPDGFVAKHGGTAKKHLVEAILAWDAGDRGWEEEEEEDDDGEEEEEEEEGRTEDEESEAPAPAKKRKSEDAPTAKKKRKVDLDGMSFRELQKLCKERGLKAIGPAAELRARLA